MRWLIFILFFSCGKYESPKALDLKDNDGDQILNANESELDKYIANIESLGKVQGKIKFHYGELKEIPFSNQPLDALNLMVRNEKYLMENDYLSEGSKIKVTSKIKIANLDFKKFSSILEFDEMPIKPDEVLMVEGKKTVSLGTWEKSMKVELSLIEMSSLIEGRAHLSLVKKQKKNSNFEVEANETIKEKTYRVYIFDGKKSEVMYVSKSLEFDSLLSLLKINKVNEVVEDQFFFNPGDLTPTAWFVRHFPNGDKVLSYANIQELKKAFIAHYEYRKNEIQRSNGTVSSKMSLTKAESAVVYLRIRATQTQRSFHESSARQYFSMGGGGRDGNAGAGYYCTFYYREIKEEKLLELSLDDVLANVDFYSDTKGISAEILNNAKLDQHADDKGLFWEIKLDLPYTNLTIVPKELSAGTFTFTGQYKVGCEEPSSAHNRIKASKTNSEGKFSLNIESFVEKID